MIEAVYDFRFLFATVPANLYRRFKCAPDTRVKGNRDIERRRRRRRLKRRRGKRRRRKQSRGRWNKLGRRDLCVASSCHFARVFARVIDRHATLIGGWNERHDHEMRTRRRRRRGEKVEMTTTTTSAATEPGGGGDKGNSGEGDPLWLI